jgi:hypothetical protein
MTYNIFYNQSQQHAVISFSQPVKKFARACALLKSLMLPATAKTQHAPQRLNQ